MKCFLALILILASCNAATIFIDERQEIKPREDEGSDEKVKLTVFYATRCPYCIRFFRKQLVSLFDNENEGLYKHVDFDLVPFVNSAQKVGDSWTYSCMHGYRECEESKIHSCALNAMSDTNDKDYVKDSVLFLICLTNSTKEVDVLEQCLAHYKLPVEKIRGCLADADLVGKLMTTNVERAQNNNPPVYAVPTIQFNNVEDAAAQDDLIERVCDHLKSKPKVCSKFSNGINEEFQFDNINVFAV